MSIIAIDVRSLITFRICFGCYILYDILLSRGIQFFFFLGGNDYIDYHIPWYTSSTSSSSTSSTSTTDSHRTGSSYISYLQDSDTPHGSIIHQIWFYRGSTLIQYVLFGITILFAIGYILGIYEETIPILYHPNYCTNRTTTSNDATTTNTILQQKQSTTTTTSIIDRTIRTTTSININIVQISPTYTSIVYKLCFYILITSYQNRNMLVHDGSDTYTRLLLLYTCFIPLNSLQSTLYNKNSKETASTTPHKSKHTSNVVLVSSMSILSISLQIVCMYCGTICRRTIDIVHHQQQQIQNHNNYNNNNEWQLPLLSAVYNALCNTHFAVRYNNIFINSMICTNYTFTQMMTYSAMIIEFYCPIIAFIVLLYTNTIYLKLLYTSQKRATINGTRVTQRITLLHNIIWYIGIVPLYLLHIGLLCCLRLPNWQIIAMIALVLWIPSNIWNTITSIVNQQQMIRTIKRKLIQSSYLSKNDYKKTDGDNEIISTHCIFDDPIRPTTEKIALDITVVQSSNSNKKFIVVIEYFLFLHMIYNFATERYIIPKYDHGDIGELFRISQYWVMYSTVGTTSHLTYITGTIQPSVRRTGTQYNATVSKDMDILQFISTGVIMSQKTDILNENQYLFQNVVSTSSIPSMTIPYPTVRWERALSTMSKDTYLYQSAITNPKKHIEHNQRIRYFGSALCQLINQDLVLRQRPHDFDINNATKKVWRWWWVERRREIHQQQMIDWFTSGSQSLLEEDSIFYLSNIEIRFQHLNAVSSIEQRQKRQKMIRKIAPDTIVSIACHSK